MTIRYVWVEGVPYRSTFAEFFGHDFIQIDASTHHADCPPAPHPHGSRCSQRCPVCGTTPPEGERTP